MPWNCGSAFLALSGGMDLAVDEKHALPPEEVEGGNYLFVDRRHGGDFQRLGMGAAPCQRYRRPPASASADGIDRRDRRRQEHGRPVHG